MWHSDHALCVWRMVKYRKVPISGLSVVSIDNIVFEGNTTLNITVEVSNTITSTCCDQVGPWWNVPSLSHIPEVRYRYVLLSVLTINHIRISCDRKGVADLTTDGPSCKTHNTKYRWVITGVIFTCIPFLLVMENGAKLGGRSTWRHSNALSWRSA